jgi:8-oxo-dGTP pyrophosphatase MutT (NUDIX family)
LEQRSFPVDECPTEIDRSPRLPLRAAAICYTRDSGEVQFLLVRTRARTTWTFPKGRIEPGEIPKEAAAREAREEAGVTGEVASIPLTRYRYPAWGPPQTPQEVCVEAYLIEVQPDKAPREHEPIRTPTWYNPAEAVTRLKQGRPPVYAREHERLIAAALDRLRA